jgi:hypothetical protein
MLDDVFTRDDFLALCHLLAIGAVEPAQVVVVVMEQALSIFNTDFQPLRASRRWPKHRNLSISSLDRGKMPSTPDEMISQLSCKRQNKTTQQHQSRANLRNRTKAVYLMPSLVSATPKKGLMQRKKRTTDTEPCHLK